MRHLWIWITAAIILAGGGTGVAVALGAFSHPAAANAPWSNQRLADELTTQFADLGATITPDMISGVLAQDCPHLDDPAALVQLDPVRQPMQARSPIPPPRCP
jgi:hypothetical protein